VSDLDDTVEVMEQLREGVPSYSGVIIPLNDRDFDGAGVEDEDAGMSRMATPLDLRSGPWVSQKTSWEKLGDILFNELLPQLSAEDVLKFTLSTLPGTPGGVYVGVYVRAGQTIFQDANSLGRFATSAGMAYSDFIRDSALDILDLIKEIGAFLYKQQEFLLWWANIHTQLPQIVRLVFQSGSDIVELLDALLEVDAEQLLATAAAQLSQMQGAEYILPMMMAVVDGLQKFINLYNELAAMTFEEILNLCGEVPLFVVEMMRSAEIQKKIDEIVTDPDKLGEIFGVLVGMVIWEVIEEVATAGLAKPFKLVKAAL
jgi:hypothetical protein